VSSAFEWLDDGGPVGEGVLRLAGCLVKLSLLATWVVLSLFNFPIALTPTGSFAGHGRLALAKVVTGEGRGKGGGSGLYGGKVKKHNQRAKEKSQGEEKKLLHLPKGDENGYCGWKQDFPSYYFEFLGHRSRGVRGEGSCLNPLPLLLTGLRDPFHPAA